MLIVAIIGLLYCIIVLGVIIFIIVDNDNNYNIVAMFLFCLLVVSVILGVIIPIIGSSENYDQDHMELCNRLDMRIFKSYNEDLFCIDRNNTLYLVEYYNGVYNISTFNTNHG